jgi:hypothetical protein
MRVMKTGGGMLGFSLHRTDHTENEGNGASWRLHTVDTLYHPESLV